MINIIVLRSVSSTGVSRFYWEIRDEAGALLTDCAYEAHGEALPMFASAREAAADAAPILDRFIS